MIGFDFRKGGVVGGPQEAGGGTLVTNLNNWSKVFGNDYSTKVFEGVVQFNIYTPKEYKKIWCTQTGQRTYNSHWPDIFPSSDCNDNTMSARTNQNKWTFKYNGGVYTNTSAPTQESLSDGVWNRQDSVWGSTMIVNNFIEADFGSVKNVSSIIVGPIDPGFGGWGWTYLNGAALQYSINGNNWTNITNISQSDTTLTTITYTVNISARYVRIIYLDSKSRYLGIGTFYFKFTN